MLHDETPMLFVKRPERGWKHIDGAGSDEAMNVEPPRPAVAEGSAEYPTAQLQ